MEPEITLRDVSDGDLSLIGKWLVTPHVARWFENPDEWLGEIRGRNGEYSWIRHYIVVFDGKPVGFCQYYEYRLGGESWYGGADAGADSVYSIDYLIGEAECLRHGLGRATVRALTAEIARHSRARRIVVNPDGANAASRALLRSCGFSDDPESGVLFYGIHSK